MKQYMLVMRHDNGIQSVQFYDDFNNANNAYNICSVSIGWYCELYTYIQRDGYTKLM